MAIDNITPGDYLRTAPAPTVGADIDPAEYNSDVNTLYAAVAEIIAAANPLIDFYNAWVAETTGWEDELQSLLNISDALEADTLGFKADIVYITSGLYISDNRGTSGNVSLYPQSGADLYLDTGLIASKIAPKLSETLSIWNAAQSESLVIDGPSISRGGAGPVTIEGVELEDGTISGTISGFPAMRRRHPPYSNTTVTLPGDFDLFQAADAVDLTLPAGQPPGRLITLIASAGSVLNVRNPDGSSIHNGASSDKLVFQFVREALTDSYEVLWQQVFS